MVSLFDGTNIEGILGVMVPIVAIVGGLSLAFGISYLRSKERLELISRGIDVTKLDDSQKYLDYADRYSRRGYRRRSPLRRGLFALGAGAGLLSAYYFCHVIMPTGDHTVIYLGFVGVFVGAALILSHLIERDKLTDNPDKGI